MAPASSTAGTSMDVPQTQNTAPVLEFRCLYTQDLRRKQKRWQDGRLKFHTFNKRVMVYDERSNFIGDTHWREDMAFDEGEELELERGGILVEVGECVGKREQDLSELVDKRLKEREERAAAKIAASTPSRTHSSLVCTSQATPGPLQHKPLNALLSTTGHYGRAVVPQTSPFEEKQRLINGNQEGLESGRRAKRRKANEDASSKSGYAQNLMGAMLSLTSSRPPSTATIRYEPVGAKPIGPESPTTTIDLTGDNDEDDERGTGPSQAGAKEDRISKDFRGKGERKFKRSPARSGYASNLTGASLTLSRPDNLSARRSNKTLSTAPATRPVRRGNGKTSSGPEEDSFIDIESVPTKLPGVAGPSRRIVKSPKTHSISELGSSSPALVDNATPTMKMPESLTIKQVKPRDESTSFEDRSSSSTNVEFSPTKPTKTSQKPQKPRNRNSSATVPTPERPASVLRIKARPPRKMMMLMDRPSFRSSSTTESSNIRQPKPKPPQNTNLASNDVVLSQATMRLDAFCQIQEEIIQARLYGKRPSLDLDDLLFSPEDRGIDHQTIDLLLSRKNMPAENRTADPNQSTSTTREPTSDGQVERSYPEKEHDVKGVLNSQPKVTSKLVSDEATKGPRGCEQACPIGQNPLPESSTNGEGEISLSHDSALQHESLASSPRVAPKVKTVARKGKEERSLTKVSQASPTMPKVPEHFSSAIQAATGHFRAIIKCSPSPEIQLAGAISSAPEEKDAAERALSVPSLQEKDQTDSDSIAVKPSPESSLFGEVSNIESELLQVGSTRGKPSSDAFQTAVAPLTNEKLDAPKARLVNPATRGKSLHIIAANTVDSLAPTFSLMPPPLPPQRTTTRSLRTLDENVVAEEKPPLGGYVGDRTIAGPWSRESYDLFGSWLPPGGLVNVGKAKTG